MVPAYIERPRRHADAAQRQGRPLAAAAAFGRASPRRRRRRPAPPATPLECEIAAAWGACLRPRRSARSRPTSSSTWAVIRCSRRWPSPTCGSSRRFRRLAIADLYAHPTVRDLARAPGKRGAPAAVDAAHGERAAALDAPRAGLRRGADGACCISFLVPLAGAGDAGAAAAVAADELSPCQLAARRGGLPAVRRWSPCRCRWWRNGC